MKATVLGSVVFALLVVSASHAQWDDDAECTTLGHYQGKRYESSITPKTLNASPDFDTANPTLPMSIKDILEVARTQLEKVTGSKSDWRLVNISLQRSNRNEKKWFYTVDFGPALTTNHFISTSNDNIGIIVTVDGRLGSMKEIQERRIE